MWWRETEGDFSTALAMPTVLGGNATLTAQNVTATINGFGNTNGLGYAANSFLGPTIKINNGTGVNINFVNQLNEKSNIHWHGLKVPANMDGHPENVVNAGGSFNYNFTINQYDTNMIIELNSIDPNKTGSIQLNNATYYLPNNKYKCVLSHTIDNDVYEKITYFLPIPSNTTELYCTTHNLYIKSINFE